MKPGALQQREGNGMSHEQEIANLLFEYAERIDRGDLAGMAELFAHADYRAGDSPPLRGAARIEQLNRSLIRLYEDGTPRTQHVTTNLQIEVNAAEAQARCHSRFTVLQEFPIGAGGGIHAIVMGRYHDRFERVTGRWRFAERHILMDRTGELRHHLRLDKLAEVQRRA